MTIAAVRHAGVDSELLQQENISYGLRRNTRALRPVALAVLIIAMPGDAIVGYLTGSWISATAVGLGIALLLAFWLVVVKDSWVRDEAEIYTNRLFTIVRMSTPPSRPHRGG